MQSQQQSSRNIVLRPPTTTGTAAPAEYCAPSVSFLHGKWHVTHSTLPMWKSKRNVTITYTPLPASPHNVSDTETDRLDDLVSYQGLDSDKLQTVRGIDKASIKGSYDAWDWRGKGWLMIASSHWEVLGWGMEADSDNAWAVTYFAKTLFTPSGLDIYSKDQRGLKSETLQQIKDALGASSSTEVRSLSSEIFEIAKYGP